MSIGRRYEALRTAGLRAVAIESLRRRPIFVAPLALFVVATLALARYPTERVVGLAAIYALAIVWQVGVVRHALRAPAPENYIIRATLGAIVSQTFGIALTGGLRSPLVVQILPMAIVVSVAFGRARESMIAFGATFLETVVLAALPAAWLGPPIASPWDRVLTVGSVIFSLQMMRGTIFAMVAAYVDAGEKVDRMREELLVTSAARARSLESIGAKVAHELKNPLASIKGLAQLMERCSSDPRGEERLSVMRGEIERMETILREYLSFSRPLEDLQPEPLDLLSIATDAVNVVEARAVAAGVKVEAEGAPATVSADPRRVKEAVMNLLANAIEATPEGGRVVVRVARSDGGATLAVEDDGRGMSAETLSRIGTPYFTTRDGGTGLGVLLARAVAAQHGGDLGYRSAEGRGTVATMTLPAVARPCERLCQPRA